MKNYGKEILTGISDKKKKEEIDMPDKLSEAFLFVERVDRRREKVVDGALR